MKKIILFLTTLGCVCTAHAQKTYRIASPDTKLQSEVTVGDIMTFDIRVEDRTLVAASPIAMKLADGTTWGAGARVQKVIRSSVDAVVASPFYRSAEMRENYNAMTLQMRGNWAIEFRAYNDGVAYRFISRAKAPFVVEDEVADYRFTADNGVTMSYVRVNAGNLDAQFANSFENTYTETTLSQWDAGRMAFLPVVVDVGKGVKVCFTETDLNDYPGLYLWNGDGGNHLTACFPPYPKSMKQGGHNNLEMLVTEREAYIAKVEGERNFPWRVAIVGSDVGIAASNLSYLLAEPAQFDDLSWIKPGKVAWDWWNDWNISGVDFRAGINTPTYKYYIDFASERGIEYVILDEGWAVNKQADLMQVVPEIDLKEIVDYGKSKGVGIILWAGYWAFDRDMEEVCKHYSEMGVVGFKVDFMNRDDQIMTEFHHRAAAMAAKYKLILDFHGTYKPAGLHRTWPNVLNFEGVHGLEQMKWSPPRVDQVTYDTFIPFIRQAAGPMDYTQGAMLNAVKSNYRPSNSEPMSQGTRCHQLALYVVLDSPVNMLCDSPTNYLREPECTEFIAHIPTVWDESRILSGEMGEYIVTARRAGKTWYIGGITNWTTRDLTIDLSALGIKATEGDLFADGVNADRRGSDYRRTTVALDVSKPVKVHLAPGGGFVLKVVGE